VIKISSDLKFFAQSAVRERREDEMKQMIANKIGAWLRGLVWTAMIAGCAWAGAQSYLVTPAAAGRYHTVAMGVGEGVGLGAGVGAEGAQATQPLPKDDLFAGTEVFAKGASDITEITMDPDTLNLVNGPDRGRARNTVLKVVRTYTYDKPGMYNMSDVEAIRNKLNTGDWHCSVHVRDLKNNTGSDVCGKRRTDGMRETAIISVEPKQLTFIHTISKNGGPGESELGYFPMLPGVHGLPAIAMMDPEAFADMQIGMHGMPFVWATPGTHVYTLRSPDMGEVNRQLRELKVRPFDGKQMEEMDKRMKDFNKEFNKDKGEAPKAAPATPKAAPAPAPAPAAPVTPQ
jgi:hypothetical protein